MRKLVSIMILGFILTGCRTDDFLGGGKGVEQGNGYDHYTNSIMGIEFDYPSSWKLTESSDLKEVSLDNSPLASETITTIKFSYLTDLDGNRFNDFSEMKTYLEAAYTDKIWNEVVFLTYDGLMWKETNGLHEESQYYVIDSQGFILKVNVQTHPSFNGALVVSGILKGMLIDLDPPEIKHVYFDKKTVKPGETITLYAEIEDKLSGVQIDSIGSHSIHPCYYTYVTHCNMGIVAYDFPYTAPYDDVTSAKLNRARIIFNNFKYEGNNLYSYEIKIPENAPLGEMTLKVLDFSDIFGNKARITVYDYFSNLLLDFYQIVTEHNVSSSSVGVASSVSKATFEVVSPGSTHIEDIDAPKVSEIYFNKTSIDSKNPTITMHLVFDDLSNVYYQDSNRYLNDDDNSIVVEIDSIVGNSDNLLNLKMCTKKEYGVSKISKNHYAIQLDFSYCNFNKIKQEKVAAGVTKIRIMDELGNKGSYYYGLDDFKNNPEVKKAIFYINL